MNRVIKFRGWDGTKMHDDVVVYMGKGWIENDSLDANSIHIKSGVESLMQFTGLTDLDCVEMYVDDIAYVEGLGNCLVKICPHYGVVFCDHVGQQVPVVDCLAERDDFKIVGNKYQDPELLLR